MRFHKYKAQRTEVDGIKFASKKEAARYKELKLLLEAGDIADLKLQPKFPIELEGQKICSYIADFEYTEDGERIIEDVKGYQTPIFKLKKKLFHAVYPDLELRIT